MIGGRRDKKPHPNVEYGIPCMFFVQCFIDSRAHIYKSFEEGLSKCYETLESISFHYHHMSLGNQLVSVKEQ